jgi:colanic acid/amylovoran biosynthesis protein
MPNIVITHAVGPSNRGDHDLLEKLADILRLAFGNPEITIVTRFPDMTARHFASCKVIHSPLYRRAGSLNRAITGAARDYFSFIGSAGNSLQRRFQSSEIREAADVFETADLIVMAPGGYLYANGASLWNNLLTINAFGRFDVPFLAAPMSIGPFTSPIQSWATAAMLKRARSVYVRESYSFALARNLGIDAVKSSDLAFWMGNEQRHEPATDWSGRFVATALEWRFKRGNNDAPREQYLRQFVKACERLCVESGERVVLYTQVQGGISSHPDVELLASLAKSHPGTMEWCPEEMTPAVLRRRIAGARGVLASRFHSGMFALQAGVPFIALGYQPKTKYILADMDMADHQRDMDNFCGLEVAGSLLSMNPAEVAERSRQALAKAHRTINDTFVKDLVGAVAQANR